MVQCSRIAATLPLPAIPGRTGLGGSDRVRLCPGGGGGGRFFKVELPPPPPPPPPLLWEVRGRKVGGPAVEPEGGTNQ